MYLDIEQKTRVPITAALADHLIRLANAPRSAASAPAKPRLELSSFVPYALPFAPEQSVGGHQPTISEKS